MKRMLWLIMVLSLLLVAGCQAKPSGGNPQTGSPEAVEDKTAQSGIGPFVGQTAPDFTLKDLAGTEWKLSDLKGKSVALVFWASWCGPCRNEIPDLIALNDELKGTNSQIISINLTSGDKLEDVKQLVSDKGIPYPVLLDMKGTVGDAYAIRNIPNTVVLNKEGVVVDNHVGAYEDIRQLLKLLEDNR